MRKTIIAVLVVVAAGLAVWQLRVNRVSANPIPVAPPELWETPVNQLGSDLSLGEPRRFRNLTVFPLLSEHYSGPACLILDRAIRSGDLEIKEKGSGVVNTVRVRNNGDSRIFGLAGDMIVGAKQDRMLKYDVLIPPNSGWLEVEVYCTEHGRWVAQSEKFGTIERVVPGQVRARAAQTESQSEVWAGVAAAKSDLGATGGGTAMKGAYDDAGVKQRSQSFIDELNTLPGASEKAVGALVAVGDEVLCLDVFATHELFERMWDKLLRSYVADALTRSVDGALSRDQASRFVRALRDAELDSRSTPGLGRLYRVRTDQATGSALVYDSRVVHVDLFPGAGIKDDWDQPDQTPNLEFRRDSR